VTNTSRTVALDVLRAVRADDAYANLLLPERIERAGLDSRDARLATELTYGTLRWSGLYDAIARSCIDRPWEEVDPDLLDVIRLGSHQLLHMRIPSHAAVDTSCELARGLGSSGGARGRVGFVNAVLRKVAAHDVDTWIANLDLDLATTWSHPAWVVRAYAAALGDRRSEVADLLAANNSPAAPTLVARRIPVAELLEHPDVHPGRWSPTSGVLESGDPGHLDVVRDGRVGVQDEGSQIVTLALTDVPIDGPDQHWLDMCAGPGGKAALLERVATERGADLVAVELHPHRAALVRNTLCEPTSQVIVGDARERPWGEQLFDRVLLDAPCTGIGALRRRPDSRWRRTPADLAQLGPLQRDLLTVGLAATRVGGVLGYVTCSPHLAETQDVVHDVLRNRSDVEIIDVASVLDVPDAAEGPFGQLWPHRHGTDAMFLALLRRTADA
jgi:16S rRNA (cytosine967-C5)-methyltransferase